MMNNTWNETAIFGFAQNTRLVYDDTQMVYEGKSST